MFADLDSRIVNPGSAHRTHRAPRTPSRRRVMPLALTDPRWIDLHTSYGEASDVVAWLSEAQHEGLPKDRLGDLINEVTHQGGTSTAMYAVAPHLVALARRAKPEDALPILTHAGIIYANAEGSCVVPCPEFLFHEFVATA